jgi:D-beta-D-heptose 7-phosphate kinase/D-beta-D-heptose 1-phosphate adenosyltransferase
MSGRLIALLQRPVRPRILLLGDLMLDRYLWGDVERISPEAPIPVLRVGRQEHRLGGAGSVASMLASLGCMPTLAAVTGDDPEGRIVRELLGEIGVDSRGVLIDPDRATTLKQRLLGRSQQRFPQHMMRVDREDEKPISPKLAEELLLDVRECLSGIDLVVISDYNKGVCAGDLIPRVVALARSAGVRVLADPVRGADYRRYAGCACITPNRVEAGLAAGMKIAAPQDGLEAARRLLQFGVEAAVVTLDRDGIAWADRRGSARLFPGRPRQVADITGAGDMVLSALAFALAAGEDYPTAIELANLAGGLEVERLGVVPLSPQELLAELSHAGTPAAEKILPLDRLQALLGRRRRAGQRIVMTNGCFDLLHPGHVASLQEARRQGDLLVVGLNSDRSVRELKGEGRPIIDQQGRAEMLAALACVDYVVIFDEASVAGLVERLLPDVLVKAAQYSAEQVVGHEIVLAHGGRVVTVPMEPAYGTTGLIEKIRSLPDVRLCAGLAVPQAGPAARPGGRPQREERAA